MAEIKDPENTILMELTGGTVTIALLPDVAPAHCARMKELARAGSYDNVAFHRVIDGFMAQTGDVQYGKVDGYQAGSAGRGGSDRPDIQAEFSDLHFGPGVVGMARSNDPNSANSQFFIMFTDYASLNGNYTVFGRVIEGMDVVNAIKRGSRSSNGAVASAPDYIASAWIKADGEPG